MDYILFEKPSVYREHLLNFVKNLVGTFAGDTQLLNEGIYCNYSECCQYYDDDFQRTSYFLDCLSLSDTQETFIRRTQNYSMKDF